MKSAHISILAIGEVSFTADSFVVAESFVTLRTHSHLANEGLIGVPPFLINIK